MDDEAAARVAEMVACVIVGFMLAVLVMLEPPRTPPPDPASPPDPFDSYPDWPAGGEP